LCLGLAGLYGVLASATLGVSAQLLSMLAGSL